MNPPSLILSTKLPAVAGNVYVPMQSGLTFHELKHVLVQHKDQIWTGYLQIDFLLMDFFFLAQKSLV